MAEKTIALLGQPNSGKSTLFNGLTGSRQHVGNWPGKTVERKDGSFVHKDTTYKIIDLPGTYSLSANSDEEVVTRNYISSGQADIVCIMADASQLNRSLFMLADYAGIRVPVVLLLNMMDVAKSQGKQINIEGFAKALGVPVVPMVAADKKEYGAFFRMLEDIDRNAAVLDEKRLANIYQQSIGDVFNTVKALLPADGIGIYSAAWLTVKLLEQDKLACAFVQESVGAAAYDKIKRALSGVKDGNLRTGDCKFQWIDALVKENVKSKKQSAVRGRFDRAATSKRWGKPIAIGMIVLGLVCSMLIGMPLMELVGAVISGVSAPLADWLLGLGVAPFLVSLLCNAVLTAVTFALQMACYVFGISFVFGFMEDIGYMARISYVFDNTMTKLGLQGKAIMPFLVSFGCNIGGVTGTRVIDSWGQRILTIALSWVIPCASTWGVVGLIGGTFFGGQSVFVILSLFIVAFLHIYITYKIFGRSLNNEADRLGDELLSLASSVQQGGNADGINPLTLRNRLDALTAQQEELLDKVLEDMDNTELTDQLKAIAEEKQAILGQLGAIQQDEEQRAGQEARLSELAKWLNQQKSEFTEYDDTITRKYVERITVVDAETIRIKFRYTDVEIDRTIRK